MHEYIFSSSKQNITEGTRLHVKVTSFWLYVGGKAQTNQFTITL